MRPPIARRLLLALTAIVVAVISSLGFASVASAEDSVTFVMTIDGKDVSDSSGSDPIEIDGEVPLEVTIDNISDETVTVQAIRLVGRSIGATVFSSEIAIGAQIDPDESESRTIELDLRGITDQANGLFEGEVQMLDPDRNVMASQDVVWDVKGSMTSLFGLFAVMLLVVTIILTAFSFRDLATGRLSKNRWWRGVRFALVGLAIGVTILVWLSVLRLVAPTAVVAYPLLLVLGIAGFVLGSFSPDPTRGLEDEDDDEDEEELDRATARMEAAPNDTSVTTPDPAVTIPGNQER
ncbi:MAG: hypothetical protein EHM63_10295 [Actinobacteria bacterium]|nr:MAG: hypothetical protein EHM63_10295 [Actinomycetota bacterium]